MNKARMTCGWEIGVVLMVCASAALATEPSELDPWVGKYPMSFFTKTRSAKTVGQGHLSGALKVQQFDWDQIETAGGSYIDRPAGQEKQRWISTLCLKYGWSRNHHIAVGIPYWSNDFDIPGKDNDHAGLANVYVFDKWKAISETNTRPAVAFDLWLYLPTGDSSRKLGDDDGSIKLTTEISKAWESFSLHLNPGYAWGLDDAPDVTEFNAGFWYNPCQSFWPAMEYNYYSKEDSGCRHDIVPGFIWRFAEGWTFKVGAPINIDSTFTDRDRVCVVFKLFYKW